MRRHSKTLSRQGNVHPTKAANGKANPPAVSNAVHLDPKTPIPFEDGSWTSWSSSGREYIPFLGTQHDFFQKILEAKTLSVTQTACINTKTSYTIGEGVTIRNLGDVQEDPRFTEWKKACNAKGHSLNKVLRQAVKGFYTIGNKPIEVVRLKVAGQAFVYLYPRNILDCRLAAPPEGKSESEAVIVSRSFRGNGIVTLGDDNKIEIPLYRPGRVNDSLNWKKDGKVERTIIWLKNEEEGYDHYGIPSSISSIIYQVLEHGSARYNLDNLENNMMVGAVLTLMGNLTQPEAQRIGRSIINQHTGAGKVGRVAVIASEQGIQGSTLQSLNTYKEGSYKEMAEQAESKILLANEWDSVLAGLQAPSALGKGSGYLQEIFDQKYKTVIRPVITELKEQLLGPLMRICDDWMGTNWSEYDLDFEPAQVSNKHREASTTVAGLNSFLEIVKLVASGAYPLDAATALVMRTYGLSEEEAKAQLGNIQIIQTQQQ